MLHLKQFLCLGNQQNNGAPHGGLQFVDRKNGGGVCTILTLYTPIGICHRRLLMESLTNVSSRRWVRPRRNLFVANDFRFSQNFFFVLVHDTDSILFTKHVNKEFKLRMKESATDIQHQKPSVSGWIWILVPLRTVKHTIPAELVKAFKKIKMLFNPIHLIIFFLIELDFHCTNELMEKPQLFFPNFHHLNEINIKKAV